MESINIGLVYNWGGWEGYRVAKANAKKQDDTNVKFIAAMMSTCTQKGLIFHYNA